MDTVAVDLTGWRNTPFPPDVFAFTDDEGAPVDLTGLTFAMDVRRVPGEGSALISLGMAPNASGNGIWVLDAGDGELRIQIGQAAMQSAWDAIYAGGWIKAGQSAELHYDLLAFSPDGVSEAWLEGTFTILAGVTL